MSEQAPNWFRKRPDVVEFLYEHLAAQCKHLICQCRRGPSNWCSNLVKALFRPPIGPLEAQIHIVVDCVQANRLDPRIPGNEIVAGVLFDLSSHSRKQSVVEWVVRLPSDIGSRRLRLRQTHQHRDQPQEIKVAKEVEWGTLGTCSEACKENERKQDEGEKWPAGIPGKLNGQMVTEN
ncbi:hypothetical protein C8J57DRAFT_1241228 [Mycena rebaudengoi]|nr:hypothetical protein C8J57DRAFT_1241228 [Mycena rebaudengoi]